MSVKNKYFFLIIFLIRILTLINQRSEISIVRKSQTDSLLHLLNCAQILIIVFLQDFCWHNYNKTPFFKFASLIHNGFPSHLYLTHTNYNSHNLLRCVCCRNLHFYREFVIRNNLFLIFLVFAQTKVQMALL